MTATYLETNPIRPACASLPSPAKILLSSRAYHSQTTPLMADILLIDDDDMLRELLCGALSHIGHTVREAHNGSIGLQEYRKKRPDLVITDIVMPDKEGLGIIMEIRQMQPDAKVIAMSGGLAHAPKLYLHMADKLGANAVFSKPFHLPELLDTVSLLLGQAPSKTNPAS